MISSETCCLLLSSTTSRFKITGSARTGFFLSDVWHQRRRWWSYCASLVPCQVRRKLFIWYYSNIFNTTQLWNVAFIVSSLHCGKTKEGFILKFTLWLSYTTFFSKVKEIIIKFEKKKQKFAYLNTEQKVFNDDYQPNGQYREYI